MKLYCWSVSDVGCKRDHNEDSCLVAQGLGLFAVADGMGGHQGGAQASRMAVEVLERELTAVDDFEAVAQRVIDDDPSAGYQLLDDDRRSIGDETPEFGTAVAITEPTEDDSLEGEPPARGRRAGPWASDGGHRRTLPGQGAPAVGTVLRSAARVAGRAIYDAAQADSHLAGMGTTLTAMLFQKGRAVFAHVGDSRAFLFREGRVEQLSQDHSWIAEQVRAGVLTEEEAKESRFRHIITRSVGFEREVDVDLFTVPVMPGDCFLLASDGMCNYFENDELARILETNYYRKVPQLLVDLANDRGGDDNITIILVYVANEQA